LLDNSLVSGLDKISYSILKNISFEKFHEILLEFFNQFLYLNKIPKHLNTSKITPILKDNSKSGKELNNIRPISISNSFSQIFERLILLNSPGLSKVSRNQFGFRKKTSCNHAIFVVKETILNYVNKGSGCRIASLDAEKAFDKVWRDGLFFKLLNKLHLSYWILLKIYSALAFILFDNNINSNFFNIETGVKQGGVLSPFFYNSFIDDLIEECLKANLGAQFKNINVSVIVYADDIMLISPVDTHLQKLLNICGEYGKLWRIKFNPTKTNVISFGSPLFSTTFYLNGAPLKETDEIEYLGFVFKANLDFNTQAIENFKKVQRSFFSISFLSHKNSSNYSPFFKSFIYKTHCLSKYTYGLEALTLNVSTKDSINILQNDLIRQMFKLGPFCHMSRILKILKLYNFNELYLFSKLTFINTIKYNYLSNQIFKHLCNDPPSYKSFSSDLILLSNYFKIETPSIAENISALKINLKNQLISNDGITDSIKLCLNNLRYKYYRTLLNELIK